jgi:hypothetical protein
LPKVWVYEEPGGIDEFYLVRGSVAAEYPGKFYEAYLALCINQNGQLFIWPIKCSPGNQEFTEMSLKHVSFARDRWIRREWDRQRRGFKAEAPTGNIPNPQWPEEIDMRELAATAFGDRLIHSIDHECLRFARAVELD